LEGEEEAELEEIEPIEPAEEELGEGDLEPESEMGNESKVNSEPKKRVGIGSVISELSKSKAKKTKAHGHKKIKHKKQKKVKKSKRKPKTGNG
jgi:hypothetical protein